MRCPCRKKSETVDYAACCEPYHSGAALPATAEALMRSRYTAFAMKIAAYITATWHPATCPPEIRFRPGQEYTGLVVHDAKETGDRATVSFTARSRTGGSSHTLNETSRFLREGGRWLYVDGDVR
jgi:SEC-C motif-containing protein